VIVDCKSVIEIEADRVDRIHGLATGNGH
jgi:hypothetical protein